MIKITTKIIQTILFLMITQITLTGCTALLPLSVITTTMLMSDERSIGSIIDDKMIANRIHSEISKNGNGHMFLSISVSVLEGRVLLTGSVASQECIDNAIKIAWSVKGVQEVINGLTIELKSIKNTANDTLIANSISSRFLIEKNFISTNYRVSVNNNVVFLLGIAQHKEEMDKALIIASNTKGVSKVVNYIIMKTDPRR
jgi:osmotically-inducible protein OsmY